VSDRDFDAARQQRAGERLAAASETEHGDAARKDRGRCGRKSLTAHRQRAHRSFRVERPTTAKRIARIQNRMMTRDSAHPRSPKGGWGGATLETRFTVRS